MHSYSNIIRNSNSIASLSITWPPVSLTEFIILIFGLKEAHKEKAHRLKKKRVILNRLTFHHYF